jgi:hypothetical protein
MIEECEHPLPKYRTEFEVSSLPSGQSKSMWEVEGGMQRAKSALYDYIRKNSYRVAEATDGNGTLDITHFTPENVVIRYVALHKDRNHQEVKDLRVGLTSFSTEVDGLSKKLQDIAREAVFEGQ